MFDLIPKAKLAWILGLALVIIFGASHAQSFTRPANPTMDYVPQRIGIYDTYYYNFREQDCRVCHGGSTASMAVHHGTYWAMADECDYCHYKVWNAGQGKYVPDVIPAEKDCKLCHVDGSICPYPIRNQPGTHYPAISPGDDELGYPHHRSGSAASDDCTICHSADLISDPGTVEPPQYAPTEITPTPAACENCHWGSTPLAAHMPPRNYEWRKWYLALDRTLPLPTGTYDNPDPQPIEPSGRYVTGDLPARYTWKPFLDDVYEGTHHELNDPRDPNKYRPVFEKCYNCHGPGYPDDPYEMRYCETCHDIYTLHELDADELPHTTDGSIYTVGGSLNQTVTYNQKCNACHGDILPELPPLPPSAPTLNRVLPNFGPPGIITDIYGANFGDVQIIEEGDEVKFRQANPTPPPTYNWCDVDELIGWSDRLVQVRVPEWRLLPGSANVRVYNDGLGSTLGNFFVRKEPEIDTANPTWTTYGGEVNLIGDGFKEAGPPHSFKEKCNVQTGPYGETYGYSTYVELNSSDDRYRVLWYKQFNEANIKIGLGDAFHPENDSHKMVDVYVAHSQTNQDEGSIIDRRTFYEHSCWEVTVVTDYFIDDGDGNYNRGTKGLDLNLAPTDPYYDPFNLLDHAIDDAGNPDAGDILIHRERSNPVCLAVLNLPYIAGASPRKAFVGDLATVLGNNFGTNRGNSNLYVGGKQAKISKWRNGRVTFRLPGFGGSLPPAGKWKTLKIIVDEGGANKVSNTNRFIKAIP